MADQEEQQAGEKGGALEAHMTAPTVTAVTDIAIPPDRVQWGPTFAGLMVTLAVTFLWTGLGIGIGFAASPAGFGGELGFWITGFAAVGLFLGSALAARTAKASHYWPAILHGVIVWTLVMTLDIFTGFGFIRGLDMLALGALGGNVPAALAMHDLGWWLFGGYLVLLAAAVGGGIVGMTRNEEHAHRV